MLSRALRPRLRQSTVRAQCEQPAASLALPWLCPAVMRWNARTARDPRQKTAPSSRPPRHETRSLATAAPSTAAAAAVAAAPFQGLAQAWSRLPDPELPKLEPIDMTKPLMVQDAYSSAGVPTTPIRFGVGGDPVELHQNLYACLRVGRLDRASAILKRLSEMYQPTAPEMVDAYNIYLQAMYEQAEPDPTASNMAAVAEWYQQHMVERGIAPNAQTFVTLLRAALSHPDPVARARTARGYLDHVAATHGAQVLEDVNASPDFSDEQWDALIRLQSESYEAPPPVEEVRGAQLASPDNVRLAVNHGFVPEPAVAITPVAQKGLGLQTLQASLAMFDAGSEVPLPDDLDATPEERARLYDYMRQVRLEQDAHNAAIARWKAEDEKLQDIGIHPVLQSKPVQALMYEWYAALVPRLEAEIKKTKEVLSNPTADTQGDLRHRYGPYLEELNPKSVAALGLSRLLTGMAASAVRDQPGSEGALKLTGFAQSLGRCIEDQFNETSKRRHQNLVKSLRKKTREELLHQLARSKLSGLDTANSEASDEDIKKSIAANTFLQKEFPMHARVHIGVLVLENIMQTAMITVVREDPKTGKTVRAKQPAFSFHAAFTNGKKIVYIMPHHELVTKLQKDPVTDIQFSNLPMLAEPKPWTSFEDGGYYTLSNPVVRTKAGDVAQKSYAKVAIENGDMKKVLAGLDVLGRVPWKINRDVFNVMSEVWNKGLGIAGFICENTGLKAPEEPASDASSREKMMYLVHMKDYQNAKNGYHSQRCFQNFQLEVARGYLNEKFYYPHSVDFRGRAYPIPPILNHIGSDIARGMLMFYNGKELGEVGLQWMKVQLANLYGYDKASLRDREQFAMDHLDDIIDSANHPLDGKRWWLDAEDPWQCLAACIELRNAMALPDPTRYVSSLPVHQDGTCNGLQHYAALGGDEAGASQVNLEPSDKPQDIYTGVAEIVKEMVAEDAKKGVPVAQKLEGKITRQVVKRTVMTNVYGVTFIGAKSQVESELKEIFTKQDPEDPISVQSMALYTVRRIFLALGRIFNGAQEIQVWLGECGDRITTSLSAEQIQKIKEHLAGSAITLDPKYRQNATRNGKSTLTKGVKKRIEKDMEAFKTSIIWTTPLKMPVVQPYRKDAVQTIKTSAGAVAVARSTNIDVVNKRKQLQAFPPNFIHSLDATHMMLSALKCSEIGMDFAAVHDSFWTHAADIPKLNTVLRDAFVRMHSEDIIGRLAAEFKARYAGAMYNARIFYNAPVAKEIHEWRRKHKYPVQNASYKELALEAERQEYLHSEDPELRKKGSQMVTPTSIWLKYKDTSSLASERLALLGDSGSRTSKKPREIKKKMQEAEKDALKSESGEMSVASIDVENDAMAADEEGLADADREELLEGEEDELADADADAEMEVDADADAPKLRTSSITKVWLPLTFPPVPKRGSWDVRRLHESKYFFS